MKVGFKHLLSFVFIALTSSCGESEIIENISLFPAEDRNSHRLGYINNSGEFVISPEFRNVTKFSEGLAAVQNEKGWWGYLNSEGEIVIDYQFAQAGSFSEGLAVVADEVEPHTYSYYYIDHEGSTVISGPFQIARSFSEGLAATVLYGESTVDFIDKKGNVQFELIHNALLSSNLSSDYTEFNLNNFSEGLVEVLYPYNRQGRVIHVPFFINKQGSIDLPKDQSLTAFLRVRPFSEKLAAVSLLTSQGDEQWGFIKKDGNLLIEPEFRFAQSFYKGLACVQLDGKNNNEKYIFINPKGQQAFQEQYDNCETFSDAGLAGIRHEGSDGFIDTEGDILVELPGWREYHDLYAYPSGVLSAKFWSAAVTGSRNDNNHITEYYNLDGERIYPKQEVINEHPAVDKAKLYWSYLEVGDLDKALIMTSPDNWAYKNFEPYSNAIKNYKRDVESRFGDEVNNLSLELVDRWIYKRPIKSKFKNEDTKMAFIFAYGSDLEDIGRFFVFMNLRDQEGEWKVESLKFADNE